MKRDFPFLSFLEQEFSKKTITDFTYVALLVVLGDVNRIILWAPVVCVSDWLEWTSFHPDPGSYEPHLKFPSSLSPRLRPPDSSNYRLYSFLHLYIPVVPTSGVYPFSYHINSLSLVTLQLGSYVPRPSFPSHLPPTHRT